MSWALEGYINDFGIAQHGRQARRGRATARRASAATRRSREYFLQPRPELRAHCSTRRSASSRAATRTATGESLARGLRPAGLGRYDYTETNGWNFAFHAPQDGQGLANLYGGRDGLAKKLDEFFATPETRASSPAPTAASSTR